MTTTNRPDYERAYFEIAELLDTVLGTEESDGSGAGIVEDVRLALDRRYRAGLERAADLDALARWLVDLDEPGSAARRTVTLDAVIAKARAAVSAGAGAADAAAPGPMRPCSGCGRPAPICGAELRTTTRGVIAVCQGPAGHGGNHADDRYRELQTWSGTFAPAAGGTGSDETGPDSAPGSTLPAQPAPAGTSGHPGPTQDDSAGAPVAFTAGDYRWHQARRSGYCTMAGCDDTDTHMTLAEVVAANGEATDVEYAAAACDCLPSGSNSPNWSCPVHGIPDEPATLPAGDATLVLDVTPPLPPYGTPARAVAEWNAAYPIGTPVLYWPGVRHPYLPGRPSRTRSRAEVLSGHTAVVWVDGHAGCIALTHVAALPAADTEEGQR